MKPFIILQLFFCMFLIDINLAEVFYGVNVTGPLKCGKKSDQTIDLLVGNLMSFGGGGFKFPENKEQMGEYCV